MPKLHHVKKARKDNEKYKIKRGDSYYWWQFAFGSKICSLTRPKRSQLTQSWFYGAIYDLEDEYQTLKPQNYLDSDSLDSLVEDIKGSLQEILEQCQESIENIPPNLEYSPSADILNDRVEGLEEWIDNLGSVETDVDIDVEDEEEREELIGEILQEVLDCNPGIA